MIVYSGMKSDFLAAVEADSIAAEIEATIYNKMHKRTAANEFRSWENSLEYMYKVLNDREIPEDSGIAIEYNIPQTSKRVDFIISGYDDRQDPQVIIVELKQWDKAEAVEGQDALVETFTGGALRKVVHPSYQAWSYKAMIEDYNSCVQERRIGLHPCVYLHNYRKASPDKLEAPQYQEYLDEAPIYGRGEVAKLRAYIKKAVVYGDKKAILYEIDHGKIKPSKSLQDAIKRMIEGNREFIMLDEQKVVYEEILKTAKTCLTDHKKRTVIVVGGPGTGKTVVAINLLAALTQEGQFAQYTSKNSAPRNVYAKKLSGHKKSSIQNMFKGSGSYTEVDANIIDTIICDEAHRLNEKSGLYGNEGENQVKEIINASLCSVFFIDESQRVTLKDIGSVNEIKKWARSLGSEVSEMALVSQFRCNGSDGYLAWLDDTLEIRPTANYDLRDVDYDLRVLESPHELRELIFEKNEPANRARILAGYCWEWLREGKGKTDVHDIVIDDFGMSWNLDNTQTFAIDPDSVHEIGCIHTSQGLEFDYVGVIIGDDMRYENGHIVTDFTKRARTDQSLKGIKKMFREDPQRALREADEIIKNTYRTLMTRGMKGCYVYCTNQALADYLRTCIGNED
ncbi:MAG: DUF2075 domain-containing protein [Lachnospiraceae bacterium]|nr:DUF2075 domain-containing protein [Lachnospiraceae bacterium]